MALARIKDLCLDANDHQALADWWCRVLGYTRRDTAPDGTTRAASDPVLLEPGPEGGIPVWVNPVGEPKTVKNRMHLDVHGDVEALVAAGARVLRRRDDEIGWDVLADPEGNEFCVFAPQD
jgi:hypothetical protein